MDYLDVLEAEAIYIMREVIAESHNPVMLYSIGKDSSVMLHLALKAFYPEPPPFKFMHIDTGWKFKEMLFFREKITQKYNLDMIVHINQDGLEKNINPFEHGASYTDVMKTEALKNALDINMFDVAFCGARRDEEVSRAKERIFSFRNNSHSWNPKNQRPEFWNLYNTKINTKNKESIRVFPLSNWTEKDIWHYIAREKIEIVKLYFAKTRSVILRDNNYIMLDDERLKLKQGELILKKSVRFRTLGCYPLTGAMLSKAQTLDEIIQETLRIKTSERSSRVIDHEARGSMERRKKEGYF